MRRDDMETFVRVVSRRSFAQAARELGLSPAAITRRILLLEQHLDVKLLNRNTRQVALTEAGTRYFSFAKRIMEEIRTEEFEISRMNSDVEGSLKVLCQNHLATSTWAGLWLTSCWNIAKSRRRSW